MKHRLLILIICLIATFSFAQKNEDVIVEPEPHKQGEYFKEKNPTDIKTVYIISKNKKTNFANDTLNVDYYNLQGLKTRTIRYEKNSPASILDISYDEKGNRKESIYSLNKLKERKGITVFRYDEENQLLAEEYQSTFAGKTERTIDKKYTYNSQKLVERNIYQTHTLSQTDSFFYDKDRLTLHKQTYHTGNTNYENIYTYNKSGQLTKRETYSIDSHNKKNIFGKAEYNYKGGQLVFVSEMEGLNLQNNQPVQTHYYYDKTGKISKMRVTYKSFYSEVTYTYEDLKLASIQANTNTKNNAYLKFHMATYGHQVDEVPFSYKEQFHYDTKGNLINKQTLINDELIYEVDYIIEYY